MSLIGKDAILSEVGAICSSPIFMKKVSSRSPYLLVVPTLLPDRVQRRVDGLTSTLTLIATGYNTGCT